MDNGSYGTPQVRVIIIGEGDAHKYGLQALVTRVLQEDLGDDVTALVDGGERFPDQPAHVWILAAGSDKGMYRPFMSENCQCAVRDFLAAQCRGVSKSQRAALSGGAVVSRQSLHTPVSTKCSTSTTKP